MKPNNNLNVKVKMLTSMAGVRLSVKPGDVADFDPAEADRLIKAGYAEAVDGAADAKVVKAVDEALAKAAVDAETDKSAAVAKAIEEFKVQAETEKAEAVTQAVAAALAKPEQGAGA